jgi:hypothetical protein
VVYDKIPREVIITQETENGLHMWQQPWTNTGKGAVSKAFFPSDRNRLRQKIPIFPELVTMITGDGENKVIPSQIWTNIPMCPCEEEEEQTTDHLIFQLQNKLTNQRNEMIKQI